MRRPLLHAALIGAICVLSVLWLASAHAAETSGPARTVDVVKVEGVIDQPVADYLIGSIEDAEHRGNTVVVLQLDTPGTMNVDPVALAQRVFRARIPVVVWVGPAPAHAVGGGFLLVDASSYAVVAPGAGVGPVPPLDLSHGSGEKGPLLRGAQASARKWSAVTGRPAPFPGAEEPGQVVLRRGVVQDFASSLGQLLRKVDGERVHTAAGPVVLHTDPGSVGVRFHELGPGRRVLHAVASPVAIYVLLVLGLAGIAFELTQAGIGIAGIAGTVALGLAVYGLIVVPFSPLGLGLFLGGQVLLAADVLLRRLDVLTLLGMAAFVAGSVLAFGQLAPAIDVPIWLIVLAAIGCLLYYGFALTVAQRSRERITTTQRGLVGLVGEARGPLAPDGPVYVKGALWRGKAMDGPIRAGTRIRVRRVEGLVLRVEPENGPRADDE
jgi:membrane-bound serine protease (ClpP class)